MKNEKRFLRRTGEEGQAIVLIALFMAGLLALVGWAIDGGDSFHRYRDAQNAADAAALAGAFALCFNEDYETAALDSASRNGFEVGRTETGYRTEVVTVTHIPDSASNNFEDASGVVQVAIQAWMPRYFIQLAYTGEKVVSVVGEWRCTPSRVAPALMGLSETCQYAINTNTSSIFVIGDIVTNGGISTASGSTTVNGTGYYLPDLNIDKTVWDSEPTEMDGPMEYREGYSAANFAPGSQNAIDAEAYFAINGDLRVNPNGTLASGLYYVTGNVDVRGEVEASVTIVALGTIHFSVESVTLSAYSGFNDNHPSGLLFYSEMTTNCGQNAISVNASEADLSGMIIAPNGGINLTGSDTSLLGGIVGQTIDLHGSNVQIYRDPVISPPTISGVR